MLNSNIPPLAERLRPNSLEEFIGQEHLVSKNSVLYNVIQSGRIPSMILWGPPGVGKTTLACIIANKNNGAFHTLSAVSSGVKDVRSVIDKAKSEPNTVLFIDEIHRFSKSQQDSLLGAVEKGIITLIGATTENPSFEVISPLLSRCQIYILKNFEKEDLINLLEKARLCEEDRTKKKITIEENNALLYISGGDARKLLNAFELIVNNSVNDNDEIVITDKKVKHIIQENIALYDKSGEQHYDIVSAFIKSIRGSDPNAAVYWLARMINGGEDPKFIARRMLILASEDIGNANPTAFVLANNCFQAVNVIGFPESRIILSQTAIYLASSPKSNASYMAINDAQELVNRTNDYAVPLHIRNAPTKLMKELGYGKDYKYSHSYTGNFSPQEYLPKEISGTVFFEPGDNPRENEMRERLKKLWKDKYYKK